VLTLSSHDARPPFNRYALEKVTCHESGEELHCLLLVLVTMGDTTVGLAQSHAPPKPGGSSTSWTYETMIDSDDAPRQCATTMDGQGLPLYMVTYVAHDLLV
jgi:hypothetical protein